jgi:PEP-CTERM motif
MVKLGSAAFAAAALIGVGSASAETLDATFKVRSDIYATWEQDSNPTPEAFVDGSVTVIAVNSFVAYFGVAPPSVVYFPTGNTYQFVANDAVFGSQVYTGSEGNPFFGPGAFDGILAGTDTPTTLIFSSVPEPSTWTAMLLGFGGLAFVGYQASRKSTTQAA